MLTISQAGADQVVSVSFHSGHDDTAAPGSPNVECFNYEDEGRAPILAFDQGAIHAHVSAGDPKHVTRGDLLFARQLRDAAARYVDILHRMYAARSASISHVDSAIETV